MDIFNVIVGTAGHIDHGKSSIVKSLTGIHPDRLKEEKERGLTIDLGFAPLSLPSGKKIGIIDVPGHEKFIKNMVAGATGIDYVILVIAADDGVMQQTREHVEIMQLLGIKKGMVVISKIDLVDDAEFLLLVEEDIRDFLKKTFLKDCTICKISTTTQQGWQTFTESLFREVQELTPKSQEGVFRMPIQRVFSSHGHGTVVTGIPIAGKVKIGDEIEILPQGYTAKVKKIHAYGQDIEEAKAGHSSALNLKDIRYQKLERGNVASVPGYLKAQSFIEGKFSYMATHKRHLKHLTPIRFHTGTVEIMGKLAILGQDSLAPGEEGFIQIRLEEPAVVAPGDNFIVRLSSPMITIGGGTIIDSGERKLKRFKEGVIDHLQEKSLSLENDKELLISRLKEDKFSKESELEKKLLMDKEKFIQMIEELLQQEVIFVLQKTPKRYIHMDTLQQETERVFQILESFFAKNKLKKWIGILEIRNITKLEPVVLDFLINEMVKNEKIIVKEKQVSILGRTIDFSKEEEACQEEITLLFQEGKFSPPGKEEVLKNFTLKTKDQLFELLVEDGVLVAIAKDIFFHRDTVEKAKQIIIDTITKDGHLISAEFRDKVQTSRKFAIPLLDYFDQVGLTVRQDNMRKLGIQA